MSFFDDDIRRSVWDGKIPVMFTLSSNDVTHHQPPSPYTMMVPRNSYFPLVTGAVRDHFSYSTLIMSDNELWLEYKGIPIKWHLPIGVLFDMLVGETTSPIWSITVHFQAFPEKVLLHCPNEESILTYYKNVLKEANYIKQGDINKLNNLNINQSNELWDGLRLHDYEKFWSINKIFYPGGNGYKHVPVRIIQNNKPPIQDLIQPIGENGQEVTLSDFFNRIPFQQDDNNNNNNNNITTSSSNNPTTILQYIKSGGKFLVQGVEPPLESSFVWLGEYFSHPDNFLYIILL